MCELTGLSAGLATLVIVVVASLLTWWLMRAVPRWRRKTWRTAAAAAGLEVFNDEDGKDLEELRIKGRVPGGLLSANPGEHTIYNATTSNQFQAYYTVRGILDIPLPQDFVVARAGVTIDGPERKTGDEAFDEQVHVGGANEQEVLAFLTPDRRQALITFFTSAPAGTTWTSKGISVSHDIRFHTLKPLVRDLALIKALMSAFPPEGPYR